MIRSLFTISDLLLVLKFVVSVSTWLFLDSVGSGCCVAKSTRGRVQILLTDKTETLKLGIQLEPIFWGDI